MVKPYVEKVEKPWGYELILTSLDSPVIGKILHIKAGARLSYQYHEEKKETLTLINGRAKIILNDEEKEMEPKKGYPIKPFDKHRFQGITDCDILEVSTPEKGTTVRLQDDYQRPDETEELRKQPNRGWKG
ncbi:cupin [Candidatus Shapirobacteria bacterium]|nr:cupin [Candidatus Shapirobacteria bacterium]